LEWWWECCGSGCGPAGEACAMDSGWIVEQAGQAGDGSEGRRTKSEVRRAWAKLYSVEAAQSEQDRRNGEAADGGR
jgi:hypothetical protein